MFDLGLHQDWAYISTKLSHIDVEVRQVVFWGCFNLDRYVGCTQTLCCKSLPVHRLWALYLGRPPFIKLTDVSIRRPDRDARTWDLRILAAWVELLDIAGQIGDKLYDSHCTSRTCTLLTKSRNTNSCSQAQIDHYTDALQQWHNSLEPSLQFDTGANSAVYHLQ